MVAVRARGGRSPSGATPVGGLTSVAAATGIWLAAALVVSAHLDSGARKPQDPHAQAVPPAVSSPAPSVLDGVFSDEQAKRGQAVFADNCAHCHGKALEGGQEAPPLAGSGFVANWVGRTVGDLVERTSRTMPEDDPASLTHQDYTDVIAFVLGANRYPSGKTELPIELEKQKLIKIVAIK